MGFEKISVPLLIVKGNFQSLAKITLEELETFIPFMTECSVQRGGTPLINGAPEWWLKTIQCKFPLKKPKGLSEMGYRRHLQSIVCRCYCYHDAHFLLTFCSKVADHPTSVFLRRNEDNTTSVFSVENKELILTFDNENKDYDNKIPNREKPRRSLLPSQLNRSSSQIIADIYLCENCDVEFYSLTDMQRHEKECYGTTIEDLSNEIQIITHITSKVVSPNDQHSFLNYLGLYSRSNLTQRMDAKSNKYSNKAPVKRWVMLDMCLYKNRKVEFSSMLGRKMLNYRARRDTVSRIEKSIIFNESFCITSDRANTKDMQDSIRAKLTFKKSRREKWSHTYSFNKKERIEKTKTLTTGLNKRSRKLLKKCKECRVLVPKLHLKDAALKRIQTEISSVPF